MSLSWILRGAVLAASTAAGAALAFPDKAVKASPDAFAQFLRAEVDTWGEIIRPLNISLD